MIRIPKPLGPQPLALLLGILKAGVILLVPAVAVILLLANWFFGISLGRPPPGDQGLDARLVRSVASGDLASLDLPEITEFEWTRFCVVGGYSDKAQVESLLELEWDYFWRSSWDESGAMAIFLDGEDVVATSGSNAFIPLSQQCFTPADASFGVHSWDGVHWSLSGHRR